MIDGLVGGKIYGKPKEGTSKNGGRYITAKVRASEGGETLFVNVITFSESAGRELLALEGGDSVSLTGSLTPKVWMDREGVARPALDMVASQVMSLYRMRKKRQAVAGEDQAGGESAAGEPFIEDQLGDQW